MGQSLPFHDASRVSREASRGGFRLLTLFSLPFCAIGLYMAGSVFMALGRGEPFGQDLGLRVAFALSFGGAGFGLLFFSRWSAARAAEGASLRERYPQEPWRWRREWATGRVPAQDGATAVFACLFALVWNALTIPLLWTVPEELQKGNAGAAFGLLFPLVGVGLLVWAVRASLRRRRFGRCVLVLDTLPGVVGGPFRGTLHVPTLLRPEDGFLVSLTCVHRVTSGHGKNRSTFESVRWQEKTTVPPTRVMSAPVGSALPVEFTVPGDVPPSSPESSDDEYVWRLAASAALPGIDFRTGFEVPVFHTAESREDLRTSTLSEEEERPTLSPVPAPVTDGARITAAATAGGVEIFFPPARSPSGAAMLTLMALFWNGLVGYMAFHVPLPVLLFLSIFLLIGFFIALGALDAWFGTIRIRVRPGELEVTRKFLGIGGAKVHRADEVRDLGIEPNGHVGSRVFYALKARVAGKKKRATLADGMIDRQQAERVLELVRGALERDQAIGTRRSGRRRALG